MRKIVEDGIDAKDLQCFFGFGVFLADDAAEKEEITMWKRGEREEVSFGSGRRALLLCLTE